MKKNVNALDYASQICKALKPYGVLLTTAANGKVNSMTIGWGCIGVDWSKPVFMAFVRESRYTKQMLEKNGEFTVNIPMGQPDKKILAFCGTKSFRDVDKIRELGLTLVDSDVVSVPGIQEFPLTLECRVIYKEEQDLNRIPADILGRYYPDGDQHHVYYGEIVNAYIIED